MTVLELAERLFTGQADRTASFAPVFEVAEVATRVGFVSSFANVAFVRTGEGLVLIDTGSFFLARQTHALVRSVAPDEPLHTAVFTHGHVDHVFGVELYEEEATSRGWRAPRVVAHEAVPARFRRYDRTRGYNACINARQFQSAVSWPTSFRFPDETVSTTRTIEVGGVTIELEHARGETDDHLFAFLPAERVLCTGDLFIWASPNAGNPQKVQRYPDEWARALRRMAARSPEVLLPGHGYPIMGEGRVREALETTASLLESLVEQTLALLNQGAPLDTILHEVHAPEELLAKPWLGPTYDEPEFVVRNIVRLYGGWWDGNPAHLKPAPEAELAAELASLAGGAAALASRARELSAVKSDRLACHLIELAHRAAPADASIQADRASIYETRATRETSLMARGVFRTAARGSEGRS
jgi:alkyl sulfatase BDS1-like metallo-beta-lactamase superfamily hydrolase